MLLRSIFSLKEARRLWSDGGQGSRGFIGWDSGGCEEREEEAGGRVEIRAATGIDGGWTLDTARVYGVRGGE